MWWCRRDADAAGSPSARPSPTTYFLSQMPTRGHAGALEDVVGLLEVQPEPVPRVVGEDARGCLRSCGTGRRARGCGPGPGARPARSARRSPPSPGWSWRSSRSTGSRRAPGCRSRCGPGPGRARWESRGRASAAGGPCGGAARCPPCRSLRAPAGRPRAAWGRASPTRSRSDRWRTARSAHPSAATARAPNSALKMRIMHRAAGGHALRRRAGGRGWRCRRREAGPSRSCAARLTPGRRSPSLRVGRCHRHGHDRKLRPQAAASRRTRGSHSRKGRTCMRACFTFNSSIIWASPWAIWRPSRPTQPLPPVKLRQRIVDLVAAVARRQRRGKGVGAAADGNCAAAAASSRRRRDRA